MAESMDHDQVAGLILARWPDVSAPWFHDLRRSQKYAPCLGRFVTLDHFFEQTELPGQLTLQSEFTVVESGLHYFNFRRHE